MKFAERMRATDVIHQKLVSRRAEQLKERGLVGIVLRTVFSENGQIAWQHTKGMNKEELGLIIEPPQQPVVERPQLPLPPEPQSGDELSPQPENGQ